MKILVVDDDPEIAAMLTAALAEQHDVASVGTGSGALSMALQKEFDLLICDLMLPDLQGTEIVRAVKAQSPRLPVIVVSALDAEDWEQQCVDAGASRYLEKPISLNDLRHEVALVGKARLNLRISLVDPDPIHGRRLTNALAALGCEIDLYRDSMNTELDGTGLLVIDAEVLGAEELVRAAKSRDIPAFVFVSASDAAAEDSLMRAGAAYILTKPVDIDAFLTQASFMLHA